MFRFKNTEPKSTKKSQIKKYFNKLSEDKSLILKNQCRKERFTHQKLKLPRRPGIFARSFPINIQTLFKTQPMQPQPKSFKARLNNNLALLMNHKPKVDVPIHKNVQKSHSCNNPESNDEFELVQPGSRILTIEQFPLDHSLYNLVDDISKPQFEDPHKQNHTFKFVQPAPREYSSKPCTISNHKSTASPKIVPRPQFHDEFNLPTNAVKPTSSLSAIQSTNTSFTISNVSFKNIVTSTPFSMEYRNCEKAIRHQNHQNIIKKINRPNIKKYNKVFEEFISQLIQLANKTNKRFLKLESTKSCLERLSRYSNSLKLEPQTPLMLNKIVDIKTPFLEYLPPLELSFIVKSPNFNTCFNPSPCKWMQNNKLDNSFFLNTEISNDRNTIFDSPGNVSNFFSFHFDRQHYTKTDFGLQVCDKSFFIF